MRSCAYRGLCRVGAGLVAVAALILSCIIIITLIALSFLTTYSMTCEDDGESGMKTISQQMHSGAKAEAALAKTHH
eukprot:scaffold61863_cov37-Tisochrysis_lutea.AAC.4